MGTEENQSSILHCTKTQAEMDWKTEEMYAAVSNISETQYILLFNRKVLL